MSKEQRIFCTELKLTVVKCCLVLGDGGPVGTSEGNHRERNNFMSVQSQNENHARFLCVQIPVQWDSQVYSHLLWLGLVDASFGAG